MALSQEERSKLRAVFGDQFGIRIENLLNEIDAGTLSTTNLAVTGTLDVTGATTLSTLGLTGALNAEFGATLDGTTSLDGTTTASNLTFSGNATFSDAVNIVVNTATGTKIGTATGQKIGFWNATPVVQQSSLTAQLTSITHTAPGTPDYALQNLVQNTGFGFATADEGNTCLSVIANLQARLAQIETALENIGLIAAN